jgi:hypothetical protein
MKITAWISVLICVQQHHIEEVNKYYLHLLFLLLLALVSSSQTASARAHHHHEIISIDICERDYKYTHYALIYSRWTNDSDWLNTRALYLKRVNFQIIDSMQKRECFKFSKYVHIFNWIKNENRKRSAE